MVSFLDRVIEGDALLVMRDVPSTSVDAVITDPPYSSGGLNYAQRMQNPVTKYEQTSNKLVHHEAFTGDNRDQRSWLRWCTLWMSECRRILKQNGYFLMFSDWRQVPTATDALQIAEFTWRGIVAWDKGNGARAPHKGYFRHQCEYVVWGTNGGCVKAEHAGPYPGCFHFPVRQSDKFHLAGKPTPLMRELVSIVPEGGIILDPFAGSGTTAVAAKEAGRHYIAIEKSAYYAAIARERLNEVP